MDLQRSWTTTNLLGTRISITFIIAVAWVSQTLNLLVREALAAENPERIFYPGQVDVSNAVCPANVVHPIPLTKHLITGASERSS